MTINESAVSVIELERINLFIRAVKVIVRYRTSIFVPMTTRSLIKGLTLIWVLSIWMYTKDGTAHMQRVISQKCVRLFIP